MLELKSITKHERGQAHVEGVSLSLEPGKLHILLGPTLSGKTTLMRLMAGLDKPTSGEIIMDGQTMTGVPVRKRNVAMVYQQFVNYPSLSVFENIASPLRVRGAARRDIRQKVEGAADVLGIKEFLRRRPSELSGGQQQRVALARALVKEASLVLLDEPLANLDYKLREELRTELPRIFKGSGAVIVYATSEPREAMLIGDSVTCLHEGRIASTGTARALYDHPNTLVTAQIMSDPPLNTIPIEKQGAVLKLGGGSRLDVGAHMETLADGPYEIGLHAHHLGISAPADGGIEAVVATTEVTGSETMVHAEFMETRWVSLLHGVHALNAGDKISLNPDADKLFAFDETGALVAAPAS
jgi:glycerol transport system ATP-binding protein